MNPDRQPSVLSPALLAASAGGAKHNAEREQIHRLAESLGGEMGGGDWQRNYQAVFLAKVGLKELAVLLELDMTLVCGG